MKKIFIILGLIVVTASCNDDDLTNMNLDTKNPSSVPAASLLSNAEKNLFDQMVNTNVNTNNFRLFAQYWTETTYLDESRYDILQRNVPDNHWRALYRDVLRDLKEAYDITNAENPILANEIKTKQNRLAIIELLTVYTYSVLVDTFGDIPYSQALNSNSYPSPAYDKASDIYKDLFIRVNTAITNLDPAFGSFADVKPGLSPDYVYQADVSKWIKFANSLKLRMAITVADDPTLASIAQTNAEAAAANVFTSSTDNATIQYLGNQPNTNPLYVDLVASERYDFVAAEAIVNKMNSLNDPRRPFYYTDVAGVYIGCPYAQGGDFENFSSAGDPADATGPKTRLLNPTLEGILLDYTEVEFYLAEAVERGYAVAGTADTHYNNAITSSILYWGGTGLDATAYLAQPTVAYATATGTWRQKIGEQAWVAYYNRGFEAWTSFRRLDFPALTAPANAAAAAEGVVPRRFTYPVLEQTLNGANYASASSSIGGDKLSTKIFWDKF